MLQKIFISAVFICFLALASFPSALAQVPIDPKYEPPNTPTLPWNVTKNPDRTRLALTFRVANAIFGVASVVAIFFIIQNGQGLVTSGLNEEKITQHKKGLMWAIIGLILIILSYSIIRAVVKFAFQAVGGP